MQGNKLKAPLAGLVYGQIVYWGVMLGALIVMIGSIVSFITRDNFVPVSYWLSEVWKGDSPSQIWQGISGALPMGHWYFSHLTTGDGLTALGISLSVFSVVPALFISSRIIASTFCNTRSPSGSHVYIPEDNLRIIPARSMS